MARSIFVSGVSAAASGWRQCLVNESPVLVASGSPAYDHHAIAISGSPRGETFDAMVSRGGTFMLAREDLTKKR